MKKNIDYNVEALRGFCALMVMIHHYIIYSSTLDPGFEFRDAIIPYTPSGHLMVMIFFMLSGYVIGITSLNKPGFNTMSYIKKRLVRLYPIYIIAILITIIFFHETLSSVTGTLFFMQNLFVNVIYHNNPLWSLNHEMVYYLLIIPVLIYNIKPSIAFAILLILLALSFLKFQFPIIIEAYITGFIFWLSGFAMSKIKIKQSHDTARIIPDRLFSVFFLLLSCDFLNVFQIGKLLSRLPLLHSTTVHEFDSMVNINDFSCFPFCLYAIVTAATIKIKGYKLLQFVVYSFCWIHLTYLVINGSFFKVNIFYVPAIFLLISTILIFTPVKIFRSISFWSFIGSISYALYVIHMPMLELIGKLSFYKGNFISFIVRIIALFIIGITISYLLEKLIQPRIRTFFAKKDSVDNDSLNIIA